MFNNEHVLELDARKRVYDCIKKSPGLHFREIQRRTGMATGSLDYHIHFLYRHGLLRMEKTGKFLHYYPSDVAYEQQEKELLNLLRQEKIRHIIIFLIERKKANATQISEAVGISASNLSFYLKSLAEKNVVVQRKKGRFRFYSVTDRKKIAACLINYKSSFLDRIVDRFVDAWEE